VGEGKAVPQGRDVLHNGLVSILRRVLSFDALLSAVVGVALVAVPRFVLVALLGQPEPSDQALVRLLGVASVVLAMLMVLIAHRIEELWWWCWAFVVLEGGTAAVATLHAALGVPLGAEAWPWWVLGLGSWAFAFVFLWGIARAGAEAPAP
jgi:hypothetical protein